jgi:hypothetical protein
MLLATMRSPVPPEVALMAFLEEHRQCGDLETEVTPEEEPSWIVMGCSCGARLARRIAREEFLDR